MFKPTELKKWLFIFALIAALVLLIVSCGAIFYSLWMGIEIWWAVNIGWFGAGFWLVHVLMRPEIMALLENDDEDRNDG